MRRPENPTLEPKHGVDRTTGCGDIAVRNFCKMAAAAILDLFELEIAPLDPPSRKPHLRTKHGVDRTTGCGDMAI